MIDEILDVKLLGQRIRAARESIGMYQYVLAKRLGVSQNHINGLECGKSKPSVDLLKAICMELHISADYLLGLNDGNSDQATYDAARALLLQAAQIKK